jgi:hypothetical protein
MRKSIYVVTYGNNWKVKCEHCGEDIKGTQAEAIKLAKSHVAGLPAGTLSQILIQGADSQFRAEWTYGKDPFPPRG